jgi:p-hydroxybenzoate 3-monooxygenase
MRTQVAIIGSGPAGLLLGQLLHQAGIDNIIVERSTKEHVLGRIRAGVLEAGTVALLKQVGCTRVLDEGLEHKGIEIAFGNRRHRIDLTKGTGKVVTVYGQTEVTRDLIEAREAAGLETYFEAAHAKPEGIGQKKPQVFFTKDGEPSSILADIIVGCDGYHGVSRTVVPPEAITVYERSYDFAWLGVLADVPPASAELVYANHARGFALCSMRSPRRSRYYIQVPADEVDNYVSDFYFWDELRRRLPRSVAEAVTTGPPIEISSAVLRSFVAEPLRFGRLFLCGDAAHIVPPTGAKGLNLAASDVFYLYEALREFFDSKNESALDTYSPRALARVWKAQRFSTWMTRTLHRFDEDGAFGQGLQEAELDYLTHSEAAAMALAENYVGLPF